MTGPLAATALHAAHYLTWGVLSISVANAIVIAIMVLVFALALIIPFGRRHDAGTGRGGRP